jgi:hypothetical protein
MYVYSKSSVRISFRSVSFRALELALPRNSECLGMSTFFRGITETVPSLFRRIFSERNSVPNPKRICPLSWSVHCSTTLYVMIDIVKGDGCVQPPPPPVWANFTLMVECKPESGRCHSVNSVAKNKLYESSLDL